MAQQTAVEWLIEQIELYEIKTDIFNSINFNVPKRMIVKAKAMEKEQIVNAHNYGEYNSQFQDALDDKNGEEYFNKTYNK